MKSWGALEQPPFLLSQDHVFQGQTSERRESKPRGTQTTDISETWGTVARIRPKRQGPVSAWPLNGLARVSSVTTQLCDFGQGTFPFCARASSSV